MGRRCWLVGRVCFSSLFLAFLSLSRVFCCFAPPTLPGYVSSPTLTSLPMPLPLPNHIYPASYMSAFSEEPVRA